MIEPLLQRVIRSRNFPEGLQAKRLIQKQKSVMCIVSLWFFLFMPGLEAAGLRYTEGNFSIYSDRGDSTLLLEAYNIIQKQQDVFARHFGQVLTKPLEIRFYFDPQKADSRIHTAPYWSSGITRAGREIHIFGVNRRQWLSTLKHELFHALVGQQEWRIPVWLNEGLAQWVSGRSDWGAFSELGAATARGNLIPLVDLDVILSFNHKRANLAYAQALDATRFLISRQGESILPYLLQNDERSFRDRFMAETEEDMIDFEIAWREDLEARFWYFKISQIPGILWALSPLIVILAWLLRRQRNRRKLDQWEQEEQANEEPRYFA